MNLISSPQSSARLNTMSELARAFYFADVSQGTYIHEPSYKMFLKENVRAFIRDNLKSPFEYKRINQSASIRKESKHKGHHLSMRIATIKKNPKDIEASFMYIALIHQMNEEQARRFEPSFIEARANMRNGEWQAITLKSIDRDIEGEHLAKFDRYNFIYSLHFSMSEPSLVAYYPTLEHMRKRKEIRLKFGKFLTNIKNEIGLENESMIKNYVDAYNSILQARNGWKMNFINSNDREGWLDVYRDDSRVSSCMSECDSVKLYAHEHSVLKLAYLSDDDGVIARTIVREDRKEYIRFYPPADNSASAKWLKSLLIDQGYSFGSLDGVLIKTYDHDEGGYLAPYIDRGNSDRAYFANLETIDNKLYFRIGERGDFCLQLTNGRTQEDNQDDEGDDSVYCEWCDDYHHDEDTIYHDNLGYSVCDGCANDCGIDAINPDGDSEFIHQDDAFYCESDHSYYTREAFDEGVILRDDLSGDFYLRDDLIEVFENVFIHRDFAITPIVPYIRSSTIKSDDEIEPHFQFIIDRDEARFLPNGEAIHYTQFDEMIALLNSFKLESE